MKQYQDKDWLYQKYLGEKLTANQIANICGCHRSSISRAVKKFNIVNKKTCSEVQKIRWSHSDALYKDRDWLYQKYWGEELSTIEIGKICGTSKTAIRRWIHKFNIELRAPSEANKLAQNRPGVQVKRSEACIKRWKVKDDSFRDEAKLRQMYIDEKLSMSQIGKQCGVCVEAVRHWMIKFDMERRAISECTKGENNPRWLGGVSFEPYSPEFNGKLKAFIRERDNHQCQKCGLKENGNAHDCHHIDYDKKNSRPENLITLCSSCHSKTNSNRQYWQNYFKFQQIKYWQNKEKQKELFA